MEPRRGRGSGELAGRVLTPPGAWREQGVPLWITPAFRRPLRATPRPRCRKRRPTAAPPVPPVPPVGARVRQRRRRRRPERATGTRSLRVTSLGNNRRDTVRQAAVCTVQHSVVMPWSTRSGRGVGGGGWGCCCHCRALFWKGFFWFEAGRGGVASGVRSLSFSCRVHSRERGGGEAVAVYTYIPDCFLTRPGQRPSEATAAAAAGRVAPAKRVFMCTSRTATSHTPSATPSMHERRCLQGARSCGSGGRPAEEAANGNRRERRRHRGHRGLGEKEGSRRSALGAGRTRCTWSTLAVGVGCCCFFVFFRSLWSGVCCCCTVRDSRHPRRVVLCPLLSCLGCVYICMCGHRGSSAT